MSALVDREVEQLGETFARAPEFVEGVTRSDLAELLEALRKSRGKVRELKGAVRILTGNKWTPYQWRGELHEEGCPGVRTPPREREPGWECKCDGDELARIVARAMR